jgi:Protein of unknown function (DUF1761)
VDGSVCRKRSELQPTRKARSLCPKQKIYHLPVLIATFAAWVLGAIWHSRYLFRARWMEAVGLSRSEVHQMVWRLAPHLLSLAVPLLFAYGVAWLLAWNKEKGVPRGVVTSMLLWAAVAEPAWPPQDWPAFPETC